MIHVSEFLRFPKSKIDRCCLFFGFAESKTGPRTSREVARLASEFFASKNYYATARSLILAKGFRGL